MQRPFLRYYALNATPFSVNVCPLVLVPSRCPILSTPIHPTLILDHVECLPTRPLDARLPLQGDRQAGVHGPGDEQTPHGPGPDEDGDGGRDEDGGDEEEQGDADPEEGEDDGGAEGECDGR